MIASKGDKAKALHLHHWNVAVSSAFHELLSYVEVVMRNALDTQLQAHAAAGATDWWDTPGLLDARSTTDIADAIARVKRTPVTHGRVVAELNFGFWRFLLSAANEQTLWTPFLQHAFPSLASRRRSDVASPVGRLHNLRNRIAHHEPIHREHLSSRVADAQLVLQAIDPAIATWSMSWCRIPALLDQKP
jgi:hypothetical protein